MMCENSFQQSMSDLVVHPASLCCYWQRRDARLSTWPMPAPPPPDKRMPMRIPIRCSRGNRLAHLVPCFETATFERQRPQHFPPWLNKVEIGRIGGLKDELPAGMRQGKQQDVGGTMHIEIVQNGIDGLRLLRDPSVHALQE